MSWLPQAEDKMSNMQPIAADPRRVRIQMEELKVTTIITIHVQTLYCYPDAPIIKVLCNLKACCNSPN